MISDNLELVHTTKLCVFHKKLKNDFLTLKLVMPFINTYNSCNTVSEIYNNQFYKTYSNKDYVCGNNSYGHLGTGLYSGVIHIPQKVLIEEKIKDIKSDYNQTYFITFDNEVYACGNNHDGYLGIGSDSDFELIPQKVLIEEKIKDIKIKYGQKYFITINGKVYACGGNKYGQLGIDSYYDDIYIPQKVLIDEKIKDIKIYKYQTYFITINNKVYACGTNVDWQLGTGSDYGFVRVPQKVLIEEKIKDIKIYKYRTYFITINNEIYACGYNLHGYLGVGSDNEVVCIPQKVLIEEKIKDIKIYEYN